MGMNLTWNNSSSNNMFQSSNHPTLNVCQISANGTGVLVLNISEELLKTVQFGIYKDFELIF